MVFGRPITRASSSSCGADSNSRRWIDSASHGMVMLFAAPSAVPHSHSIAGLQVLDEHLLGALRIARACATRVRPGGSLTFITGTDARRPGVGGPADVASTAASK